MTPSRNFTVSGRVQGVGFRHAAKRKAERLALTGWVRNLPGGEVEMVVTGSQQKLAEFEAWLWVGPEQARVTRVSVSAVESDGADGFRIRL